eukprot:scaffold9918_cov103-Alexandrium_tamarense.AAC.1
MDLQRGVIQPLHLTQFKGEYAFIPLVLEKGLDIPHELFDIPDGAAVETSQALARNEGILTGISGGATMYAAIETAKKAPEGSVIVTMLPDT